MLCLGLLCSNYSNSQTTDSTTGNLINTGSTPTDTTSTWNNGVYVDQLCFQAGQPGNCGPNPSVRPGGNINFSYGTTDLNQIVNINAGLASVGSNIQLSGFNFGFMAKNGNGWDDARQDYLAAYVKLYGSSGNQVANYDYSSQTNRKYNWTQFNFSETFATPYTASSLSTAQVGFVGRDNNFWAGNYGPEIYNVSFSLKYSVKPDPCINDPLSSPTCPGYALATVKNTILGSTVASASATSYVPTTNSQPAPAAAPPALADAAPALAQASPQQQAQQPQQQSPAQQGPAPAPQGQDPNQNPSVAQDNPSQPSPTQAGPAPTSPQPAGSPPQTVTASAPPPSAGPQQAGPTTGPSQAGPSKLAMSVVKSAQEKDKATQATAVQNAAKAFDNAVQQSNATSNAAVSMNQDMSANSATAAAQFSSQSTQASIQAAVQSSQSSQQTQQASTQQQANKSFQQTQQIQEVQQTQQQTASTVVQVQPPQQTIQQVETQTVATVKVQTTQQIQEVQQTQQPLVSVVQVQPPQQAVQQVETQAVATVKVQTTQQETQQSQIQAVDSIVQVQPPQQAVQQVESQTVATVKMQAPQQQETQQSQIQVVDNIAQLQPPVYTPPVQQETQSTSVVMLKPPVVVTETQQQSSGTGITVSKNTVAYNPFSTTSSSSMQSLQVQTAPVYQTKLQERVVEVETPQMQVASFGGMGKAGNPLNDMMQQRFELLQTNIEQRNDTVKKNVEPNDLAGGVDLAKMISQPKGFEAYSVVLRDAAFYEPKEVYKGQTVIDNAKALRQMSSDSLHKRMVDMQYKQGE